MLLLLLPLLLPLSTLQLLPVYAHTWRLIFHSRQPCPDAANNYNSDGHNKDDDDDKNNDNAVKDFNWYILDKFNAAKNFKQLLLTSFMFIFK